MCGFSGLLSHKNHDFAQFTRQADKLEHRGRTSIGSIDQPGLFLRHHRLSFQDASTGVQPMLSDGWYVVFNGEIYNHHELRAELKHKKYRGYSDTETLLHFFLENGIEALSAKLEGEYVAVFCREDGREFYAVRDNYGVKPLYFYAEGVDTALFADAKPRYDFNTFEIAFSSEIKGIYAPLSWNREGLLRQFVGLYEPIRTPYNHIFHCPPGGIIHGKKTEAHFDFQCQIILNKKQKRSAQPRGVSHDDFRNTFSKSVTERLLSDVELGVYLSGGIDSKAVAYELFQKKHQLKSFTISFTDKAYDEVDEALRYARHFRFQPHVIQISQEDLNYSYPIAVYHSENIQPFTNGAAKWWLSRFTRKYVPGVLTGDGADEVLCGYPSFRYCAWWKFVMRGSQGNKKFEHLINKELTPSWRNEIYRKRFHNDHKDPWLAGQSSSGLGYDFIKSLELWGVPHPLFEQIEFITTALLGHGEGKDWLAKQRQSVASWFLWNSHDEPQDSQATLRLWQNYFLNTHLPVQVLNWVGDRMEMANNLEGRTPFLSKRLLELFTDLKDQQLVRGFREKSLLRESYQDELKDFSWTPKKQFNAPLMPSADLWQKFNVEKALDNIIQSDHLTRLWQNRNSLNQVPKHHLFAAFQTAVTLGINNWFLVEKNTIIRDTDYENKVCSDLVAKHS